MDLGQRPTGRTVTGLGPVATGARPGPASATGAGQAPPVAAAVYDGRAIAATGRTGGWRGMGALDRALAARWCSAAGPRARDRQVSTGRERSRRGGVKYHKSTCIQLYNTTMCNMTPQPRIPGSLRYRHFSNRGVLRYGRALRTTLMLHCTIYIIIIISIYQ